MPRKEHKTSWGHVGGWYDDVVEDDDSYQKQVIMPNLLRIMEPQNSETILDLACGQGIFARELAKSGATVFGVDIAKDLIAIARSKSKDIIYHAAPSHKMDSLDNNAFDKVCIVLALQNIERLDATIQEVDRILKPDGTFYIVLNHPSFRIPGASAWGYDEEQSIQYRRVDAYMSEQSKKIEMTPGKDKSVVTYSFHRPLQIYMKALRKKHFAITRLEEWISHKESERGPRKISEDRSRREFPMFMAIECRKI